jgi:heterotetrameric sarcosine oxidase gamma subunit
MEREALAAGAQIELRDGWNVAVGFDGAQAERERCRTTAGFADRSHLGKLELQASAADLAQIVSACTGGEALELGRGVRARDAWWCATSRERALVFCEPSETAELREQAEQAAASAAGLASVIDLTSTMAGITIAGPLAPEVFARFTALDLRPQSTPVHGFRPGSVARTPAAVLREDDERWLMVFGAALGSYVWTVVADAAAGLGGGPVGVDALEEVPASA